MKILMRMTISGSRVGAGAGAEAGAAEAAGAGAAAAAVIDPASGRAQMTEEGPKQLQQGTAADTEDGAGGGAAGTEVACRMWPVWRYIVKLCGSSPGLFCPAVIACR